MFSIDQYQLVDFGTGRKLERFGRHLIDRPSPAAQRSEVSLPDQWLRADVRYDRTSGETGIWTPNASLARHGRSRMAD